VAAAAASASVAVMVQDGGIYTEVRDCATATVYIRRGELIFHLHPFDRV